MAPVLYIIPCYNEAQVLPITASLFLRELTGLIQEEKDRAESRILFANGGSHNRTNRNHASSERKEEDKHA